MTLCEVLKGRFEQAAKSGKLWIGGEMEIPYPCTCEEAYKVAFAIACESGYLVNMSCGKTILTITGSGIPGESVDLDWFHADRPGPIKFRVWSSESVRFDMPAAARADSTVI